MFVDGGVWNLSREKQNQESRKSNGFAWVGNQHLANVPWNRCTCMKNGVKMWSRTSQHLRIKIVIQKNLKQNENQNRLTFGFATFAPANSADENWKPLWKELWTRVALLIWDTKGSIEALTWMSDRHGPKKSWWGSEEQSENGRIRDPQVVW